MDNAFDCGPKAGAVAPGPPGLWLCAEGSKAGAVAQGLGLWAAGWRWSEIPTDGNEYSCPEIHILEMRRDAEEQL